MTQELEMTVDSRGGGEKILAALEITRSAEMRRSVEMK